MNPHESPPVSPIAMVRRLWLHRELIRQMTWRDVLGRYRGSVFGLAWSFFNPLLMLLVYTFVFSGVFKARWEAAGEGPATHTQFAVVLFVGLIVNGLLAEILNRAPSLVLNNVNYVKKVVFPLEILPVVASSAAVFHAVVSVCVLLVAILLINGQLPWTILLFPIVIIPIILLALGLAWFLASLGVFVRDVNQSVGILTTVLMFLAPVFYPVTALPEEFRPWLFLNPLTLAIEQAREVLIWGRIPAWGDYLVYLAVATITAWTGYFWFQRTRKGFADVL